MPKEALVSIGAVADTARPDAIILHITGAKMWSRTRAERPKTWSARTGFAAT